jgi:5-methylthioadenosine/S-adenosylhomocysteine deaminase
MTPVDQIIFPRWLIQVEHHPSNQQEPVVEEHGVVIHQGRIVKVAKRQEIEQSYQAETLIELNDHVLLPGLINAHTHSAMTLLRGYADDMPLMEWLSDHIWPVESRWVDEDFIRVGTNLAIAEMIRSGTTCFNDMYFFPDVTAYCAQNSGIRACVGMIVIDFPTVWASNADEYINKGLNVRDQLRHSSLVSAAFAPHAPYTVSDKPLERIRTLADELECAIHMHVHETEHEIEESSARFGMRPLERLDQLGLLSPRLCAVHMTQLLAAEIQTVAERGVNVVHCAESNLKLASGMCQVNALLDAGVNLAIGTDGASSNNDLNMIGEMRTASLLAKGTAGNPSAMNAYASVYAATMAGAVAMGLEQEIGSIEPGKAADAIAIDLSAPETQPIYHPLSQLVYSAGRSQVTDVWVAGKRLLDHGNLKSMDQAKTTADAAQWGLKISQGNGH